jgi:flavin-dependent dehydrogenase
MAKKYDVIIIGAGPAGAMAAKTAGENGLKVALLERRKNIRKLTRPCAEGLLCHKYDHGEHVKINFRDNRIVYPYNGFSVKYDGPLKGVYKFDQYSPDGHTMEMKLYLEERKEDVDVLPRHFAIDKEQLINGLLDEARKNHVEIFPGVNVNGLEKTDEGVVITGNGEPFEGTYALAADGLNSRMARQLGFNQERKFLGTFSVKGWRMRGVEPPDPEAHIHIVEGVDAPPLFCICPQAKTNEYYISIGGWAAPVDFNARLNNVMNDSLFSPWFKKAEILKENCCILNFLSPIIEPFKDNVLLIGDAAAFGQISNHNAILSGWKAANTLTVSLTNRTLGKEGVSGYIEWWNSNFYDKNFSIPPTDFLDTLTREEVNFYFSLFTEPLPPFSGYEEMQKIFGEAMAKIMPQLKAQRPDILTKMKNLKEVPPEETWAERRKSGFPNK